jgi:hypothetical protein
MNELNWNDLQWCLRRSPRRVLELLKARPGKVFVGGGFVRACVANETVNDVDLFTTDKDSALSAARYLLGLKDGEDAGRKLHETQNAYTVMGLRTVVQLIHRWTYTSPEQLMQSFDFTIAMAGFWWEEDQTDRNPLLVMSEINPSVPTGKWRSICDDRFYEDLAAKRLRYTSPVRNEDAGGSLLRVLKFYQRGYRIPLDSLGSVLARLVDNVDLRGIEVVSGLGNSTLKGADTTEKRWAKILTGLLREVDPAIDPSHISHLLSCEADSEDEENEQID